MSKAVTGFVVGVAVATTGTVMISSSDAGAGPGDVVPGEIDATFVPIKPCRLFDLRTSEFGLRTAPLAPGEILIQQVRGEQGDCHLPDDVVGVSMNVTIVDPTAASYLTIYPANSGGRPLSSNLNWVAGQAPTPNKVDVAVSASQVPGRIIFYNAFGTVYVVADVVGYYTGATLDQINKELHELDDRVPTLGVFDGMSGGDGSPDPYGEQFAKVTATATIDLDTSGVDAGSCTITGGERVGGEPVEFSDAGTPESQMRFPITVVQVLRRTRRPDGYGAVTNGHALECETTSGTFDVLNASIIIETYDEVLGDGWQPID